MRAPVLVAVVLLVTAVASLGLFHLAGGNPAAPSAASRGETPRAAPPRDPRLGGHGRGTAPDTDPATSAPAHAPTSIWGEAITFHVVDETTKQPIEGALVQASVQYPERVAADANGGVREAYTDAQGVAEIPRCDAGAEYAVRKVGYGVRWCGGRQAESRVELTPLTPFRGQVVDPEGRAVVGAHVLPFIQRIRWMRGDLEQRTDAEGRFTVAGVDFPFLMFLVSHEGYVSVQVEHADFESWETTITLGEGAVVEGVVVDEAGRPVPRAVVTTQDVGSAVAGGEGRYRIAGFAAPMEVRLSARGPDGRLGQSALFALRSPRAHRDIKIEVHKVGSLEVVAVDAASGEIVTPEDLHCRLERVEGSTAPGRAVSFDPKSQQARFPDLAAGRYTLRMTPDFWGNRGRFLAPPPQTVAVDAGAPTRLEIRLETGMAARGRILSPDGETREAHVVFRSSWRGVPQECCADAEGSFRLAGIPPGPGTLIVRCTRSGLERSWEIGEAKEDLGGFALPRGGILEGRLPDLPPGTRVLATIEGGILHPREGRHVSPEADGRFRIEDLPAEHPFDLFLERRGGGERIWTDLLLAPGEARDLGDISWQTRMAATGRVLDANGLPVHGAKVTFYSRNGAPHTRTDQEGNFRITNPPVPCAGIRVDVDDHPAGLFPPPMKNAPAPALLRLPRPGRLRIRFVRTHGEPMAGATLHLAWVPPSGEIEDHLSTTVSADGEGWMDVLLPPGTWRVEIWGSIGGEIEGGVPDVRVDPGSSTRLVLDVR